MANSFEGDITNTEFQTVESLTVGVPGSNFTGFTSGKTYTIQVVNHKDVHVLFKVSDAIFKLNNQDLQYTAGEDDPYINTLGFTCKLTILEENA